MKNQNIPHSRTFTKIRRQYNNQINQTKITSHQRHNNPENLHPSPKPHLRITTSLQRGEGAGVRVAQPRARRGRFHSDCGAPGGARGGGAAPHQLIASTLRLSSGPGLYIRREHARTFPRSAHSRGGGRFFGKIFRGVWPAGIGFWSVVWFRVVFVRVFMVSGRRPTPVLYGGSLLFYAPLSRFHFSFFLFRVGVMVRLI